MSEYTKKAQDFCRKTGTTIEAKFLYHASMPWDTKGDTRDIYQITITRDKQKMEVTFGQSIANSVKPKELQSNPHPFEKVKKRIPPNEYDVLACLTKYDVGSYKDFCAEFGYYGSEESLKIWADVRQEYAEVSAIFGDVMDELQDIS